MNAYWAQWSSEELMSMQGIDAGTYQDDDHDDSHHDRESEESEDTCCSGCMDCLGLSWRDFM